MEIKSAIKMGKNREHKILINSSTHFSATKTLIVNIAYNTSFPSLKQKDTENYDKRAANCTRLLLRLTESHPTHFSVQPLKGPENAFLARKSFGVANQLPKRKMDTKERWLKSQPH